MTEPPSNSSPDWKPFGLTYVEYHLGDSLGALLAASSLVPLAIVIAFITHFAVRRDLHTFTYGVGIILNYAMNMVLKHTIKELRPDRGEKGSRDPREHWNEYGMPSSHSQFMWFYTFYMLLFVMFRLPHEGKRWENIWKSTWLILNAAVSLVVVYGRVYLSYHTVEQVFYGGIIGCLFAYFWFSLTQKFFTPVFPMIASSYLGDLLLIRDLTNIPNVTWYEFVNARTEALKRTRATQRKPAKKNN